MVVEPPLTERKNFEKGETLEFGILLFGELNKNLPYFVYACQQMGTLGIGKKINGKRSRFRLESVRKESLKVYDAEREALSMPENLERLNIENPIDFNDHNAVRIIIKSPLRILKDNGKTPDLQFPVLVRSMIRRVTSLLNTYGPGEPSLDYSGLVKKAENISIKENALSWFDWKRYSASQDRKMFMGGLTGQIEYKGGLGPFLPFLKTSEKVHAGKNTAFGLGWIALESVEQ